jgi:2-keto-4-pentenoate hydratase/2-oxohepta-3-ene-1,7-dioic acid hydratase in catechol pathway
MRFCAFREYGAVAMGFQHGGRVVGMDDMNDAMGTDYGPDLDAFLDRGQADAFRASLATSARSPPTSGWKPENLQYAPPLARPGKIWGIGLNFAAHASDLKAERGESPTAWMRPPTTLAGAADAVALPAGVGRVTAEAEIAVVLGRGARNLGSRKEARDAVFGFMPVLDLTAEELLQKNARYLTQAKSYDGFCVTGPFVVTTDEWEPSPETRIATVVNSERKEGTVAQMQHDPYELVRHFSHVFSWAPGDILLTGTPGALPLAGGATMRAEIDGLPALTARVA